jgi:PAS domain S-box-containing protein/putative nucleotidyltransferase with HDIG domain
MDIPLRLLIIEDSQRDVALELRALEAAGYRVTYTVADTAAGMKAALAGETFDIVISDHDLPQFDAPGALAVLKQSGLDIPFIIVSAAIGEEKAVALMKAGAHDYVLKDRLSHLASAVERALKDAENLRGLKRAEKALEESERKFSHVFYNAPLALSLTRLRDGILFEVNDAWTEIYGYTRSEVYGKTTAELGISGNPEERARIYALLQQKGNLHNMEITGYHTKENFSPIILANFDIIELGQEKYILTSAQDITESKRAAEALKASEAQYRLLSEHITDTVWLMDMNLNFIYHSPSVEKMRGFTAREIVEMPLDKQVTRESLEIVSEVVFSEIPKVQADPDYNPILTLDIEYTCKDGSTVWTENKFSVIRDENNKLVGILGEARDITERRQAVKDLRESEQLYRSLFENMLNGFAYCRMLFEQGKPHDFIYLAVNSAFEKQTGLKDVTGKRVTEVIPGIYETDPHIFEFYGRAALTGIPEYLEAYVASMGMWFSVSVYSPQKEYFVAVFDVITERKLSEEKLLKSYESVKKTLNDAINTMVKIVEMRDPYTAGHQQKVADLATAIAREMKLEDTQIDDLRIAAVIHDIGKIYIPSDILSRPGKLSDIEFSLIKTHAQSGYDIVKGMDLPAVVAQAILQHHERLDGSGYPGGLKSEDLLLEAEILAVADVVEAMAADRPYRAALGIDKALEEISRNKGRLYDPDVSDACLELFNSGKFEFR